MMLTVGLIRCGFAQSDKEQVFQPLINKLYAAGVDSNFIRKALSNANLDYNEKFVKINVTGAFKKPDYSGHYNKFSVKKSKTFYKENLELLKSAEQRFGVPAEVIASVLWVETRHGAYLGNNNIASVFFSTALANLPENIQMNKDDLKSKFVGEEEELDSLFKRIEERANKKAKWAFEQILALEKLDKVSPIDVFEIKGSWAGAFGMSQFLPSSYISWAFDGDSDGVINLFHKEDAVFSVANYLKSNGWGESNEAQRAAVFHYNNSNDYVDAVLKLASLIVSEDSDTDSSMLRFDIKTPLNKQLLN
jgi:membrane-bound lytic murein transglycosylase B